MTVKLVLGLQGFATRNGKRPAFAKRFQGTRKRHIRRRGFFARWTRAGGRHAMAMSLPRLKPSAHKPLARRYGRPSSRVAEDALDLCGGHRVGARRRPDDRTARRCPIETLIRTRLWMFAIRFARSPCACCPPLPDVVSVNPTRHSELRGPFVENAVRRWMRIAMLTRDAEDTARFHRSRARFPWRAQFRLGAAATRARPCTLEVERRTGGEFSVRAVIRGVVAVELRTRLLLSSYVFCPLFQTVKRCGALLPRLSSMVAQYLSHVF